MYSVPRIDATAIRDDWPVFFWAARDIDSRVRCLSKDSQSGVITAAVLRIRYSPKKKFVITIDRNIYILIKLRGFLNKELGAEHIASNIKISL